MKTTEFCYFPETPAGTVLINLRAKTEQGAWDKLMHEARHMPYRNKTEFIERGYKVLKGREVQR